MSKNRVVDECVLRFTFKR